jgi:Uma2 family endonuclease
MAVELPRHKFTAEEFEKMAEAGLFVEDRVELLDGDIVQMSPIGPPHARCVNRLNMFFATAVRDYATVQVQGPVRIGDFWVPQPDLTVMQNETYLAGVGWATPEDVLLVIEVSDTSLRYDRAKLPAYARAGVQEAWLVHLPNEVVFVHREPVEDEFRVIQTYRRGEHIGPLRLRALQVEVDAILG